MVYVFLADGFEESEAITTIDLLRRAELEVVTVGVTGEYVTSSRGITVKSDVLSSEIVLDDNVQAVVLPGGMPGTTNLAQSEEVKKALVFAFENKKLIASICAAATVLYKHGLLSGKKAAVYPSFKDELKQSFCEQNVVVDLPFITANALGSVFEFSFEIIKFLKNDKICEKVKNSIYYN